LIAFLQQGACFVCFIQQPYVELKYASNTTAYTNYKNVKSFPSRKTLRAALISVVLALSQTPVYTARLRIRG